MSEDDPLIGTRVADRYRIERKLGEGGMGLVYLAVHEGLRKPVALKILTSTTRLQRESVARFEREAIAAGNLKHPNIAEATDFGQLPDGGFYLVMEYVEGATLRQLLQQNGKLPPERALVILEQVGAALAAAHEREVVHRDLKPENVIVSNAPNSAPNSAPSSVKVIDFGIAKLKSATFGAGGTGLTKAGSVFGTAEYMSPEQVMGQTVDARADQYALGVLAFELLTGKPPFAADDAGQLMMMHVGAPVPSPREQTPGLPPAIDEVIAKMLGKLPDERFASVNEAMKALSAALRADAPAAVVEAVPNLPPPPPPPPALPPPALPPPTPTMHRPTLVSPRRDVAPAPVGRLVLVGAAGALLVIAALVAVIVMRTSTSTSKEATSASPPGLTAALADWNAGRFEPASAAIAKEVAASPELAELENVSRPLAAPVGDEAARRALAKLLDTTALGRSRAMAAALADVAVTDEPKKRDAALGLLRTRHNLLSDEQAARTRLRDAETCEALEAAKELESEEETAATTRDLERLDLGECKAMLRVSTLCDACRGGPNAAPDRGKAKGKGKGKKP